MELAVLVMIVAFVGYTFQARDERRRIGLLGHYLGQYQIEKLMQTLTDGYMRALGEERPERQAQVWAHLNAQEDKLNLQFTQFAKDFGEVCDFYLTPTGLFPAVR